MQSELKGGGAVFCSECKKDWNAAFADRRLGLCINHQRARWRHQKNERALALRSGLKHGISPEAAKKALADQKHACAICLVQFGTERDGHTITKATDHCHTTGHFRAFLCMRCNAGIGYFLEDEDALRRAADYLGLHRARLAERKPLPPDPGVPSRIQPQAPVLYRGLTRVRMPSDPDAVAVVVGDLQRGAITTRPRAVTKQEKEYARRVKESDKLRKLAAKPDMPPAGINTPCPFRTADNGAIYDSLNATRCTCGSPSEPERFRHYAAQSFMNDSRIDRCDPGHRKDAFAHSSCRDCAQYSRRKDGVWFHLPRAKSEVHKRRYGRTRGSLERTLEKSVAAITKGWIKPARDEDSR